MLEKKQCISILARVKKIFYFGEEVKGYDIRVLNEREIRAGAGILFFFALISFMYTWMTGNFYYTQVFVVVFLVDFVIRIFVNPKFSPSLILGRIFVSNQQPEYVGAKQKKFAWFLGLVLAAIMFYSMVLNTIIGPWNMLICILCLWLLFSESVFGICWGCKVHSYIYKEKAEYCPGGTCEIHIKEDIQKINIFQIIVLILFFGVLYAFVSMNNFTKSTNTTCSLTNQKDENKTKVVFNNIQFGEKESGKGGESKENRDCEVPDWAIKIGHEEIWKEHHGCK